jgi:hypothetical protein
MRSILSDYENKVDSVLFKLDAYTQNVFCVFPFGHMSIFKKKYYEIV